MEDRVDRNQSGNVEMIMCAKCWYTFPAEEMRDGLCPEHYTEKEAAKLKGRILKVKINDKEAITDEQAEKLIDAIFGKPEPDEVNYRETRGNDAPHPPAQKPDEPISPERTKVEQSPEVTRKPRGKTRKKESTPNGQQQHHDDHRNDSERDDGDSTDS